MVGPTLSAGRVLDFGAYDVNGSYRSLWAGWEYVGVDIEAGPNVDRVVPVKDPDLSDLGLFDCVISGQCLEHVTDPFAVCELLGRSLKPGGFLALVAPFAWEHHRYPLDCWRFAPDGMAVLVQRAGCTVLETGLSYPKTDSGDPRDPHPDWYADCYGFGRKT